MSRYPRDEIENKLPKLIKEAYGDDKTDRRITLKADLKKIKKSGKETTDPNE
jgi:formyltetrahydrofolate synthetase